MYSQRNWFDGLKLWRPEGKSPFNHQYHIFFLNEIRWNESPEDNKMHCAKTWKAPSDISLILEEISILNICPPNNFLGAPYSSKPISHSLVILAMNISVLIHKSESALKPRFNLVNGTALALEQLLETACEVTTGQISMVRVRHDIEGWEDTGQNVSIQLHGTVQYPLSIWNTFDQTLPVWSHCHN